MIVNGKPNKITYLTPDKPIGANINKGFADTFNWVVRFCNNLQGDGYYITVENPLGDQPKVTWGETPPGSGGGEVTFTGTDETSTVAANAFTFQSAEDSNVVITCSDSNITIGCYYL